MGLSARRTGLDIHRIRQRWQAQSFGINTQVVRSEAERTGLVRKAFQVCTPVNVKVSDAGTQFFERCSSAQPGDDFQILPEVRTGRSFVWVR